MGDKRKGVSLFKIGGLIECEVLERINRFTVIVRVEGREEKAHLTNTGRLKEHLSQGKRGLCAKIKGVILAYRLLAVEEHEGLFAIVDTLTQQKAFEVMVGLSFIPWLKGCMIKRRNPRVLGEVVDYELSCPSGTRFAELKSAVLRLDEHYAGYPDCPSKRGRRQIAALMRLPKAFRPLIIFVAALPGVRAFRPFCEGDPQLARILRKAVSKGLEARAISIHLEQDGTVVLTHPDLPVSLEC